MGADLGVPLSDLRPLCVSVAGGEVRCFIDAIFGHSLGSGVSTRAGRGPSSPHCFKGASGSGLPVTRAAESRKTFTQLSKSEKREKREHEKT